MAENNYICMGCGLPSNEFGEGVLIPHPTFTGIFCPFCREFGKTPEDLVKIREFAGKHFIRGVREGVTDID